MFRLPPKISKIEVVHKKFCSPEIFVLRILQVSAHLPTPLIPPLMTLATLLPHMHEVVTPEPSFFDKSRTGFAIETATG